MNIQPYNLKDQNIQCSQALIQQNSRSSTFFPNPVHSNKSVMNESQQIKINEDEQKMCAQLDHSNSSKEVILYYFFTRINQMKFGTYI